MTAATPSIPGTTRRSGASPPAAVVARARRAAYADLVPPRPSPLQNRVTPFGAIVAVPERGLMMGNRGVLHDDASSIRRPYAVRRWIACVTEFRGRYQRVMTPRRYTELFFLDEATAFSAGHRPCAECRSADYRRFRALWRDTAGEPSDADAIDRVLHAERLDGRRKRTASVPFETLPDGAFVARDDAAWLVLGDALLRWTPGGYAERRARPRGDATLLTPPSIVRVLRAGYVPLLHPSARR